MATIELAAKLERRRISCDTPEVLIETTRKVSEGGFRALDFPDFSLKELKQLERVFKKHAEGGEAIEFSTLKAILQRLQFAQTHVGLKKLLQSVHGDNGCESDGVGDSTAMVDFRAFLLLLRKIKSFEENSDAFANLLASAQEIDVQEAGVGGARGFFEAKANVLNREAVFVQQIRELRDERLKEETDKKQRLAAFRDKQSVFK